MDDTIIRQVPFAREGDVCPLCGNQLSEHKTFTVQSDYYPKYSFDFLYCPCCDIPFTNAEIGKQIKKQLHFGQRAFITKKNCTIENIRNMMSKDNPPPHKITGQNQIPRSKSTLKATDYVIWRYPKKLVSLNTTICVCPKCREKLEDNFTRIPVKRKGKEIVYKVIGKYCRLCDMLYVTDYQLVSELLRNNDQCRDFTLNGKSLCGASKEQPSTLETQKRLQKDLRKITSSVVMLMIRYKDKRNQSFTIVNDKSDEKKEANILHYSCDEALELLSAAFAKQRKKKGVILGQEYDVEMIVYKDKSSTNMPQSILPTDLTIRSGGGLFNSSSPGYLEVVDVLLFSPFTQRYELMRSTYDKYDNYCYSDLSVYRAFVNKFGKPSLDLYFDDDSDGGSGRDFDELRTKSILKVFGYSVKKGDNLSPQQRQRILSEVIDLELLTVKGVISLLDFFISTHTNDKYSDARSKWEADKKFVAEYKVNPQRFLIAK